MYQVISGINFWININSGLKLIEIFHYKLTCKKCKKEFKRLKVNQSGRKINLKTYFYPCNTINKEFVDCLVSYLLI